ETRPTSIQDDETRPTSSDQFVDLDFWKTWEGLMARTRAYQMIIEELRANAVRQNAAIQAQNEEIQRLTHFILTGGRVVRSRHVVIRWRHVRVLRVRRSWLARVCRPA